MTPRLAELLAAMVEAALAADAVAPAPGSGTVRRPEPLRRPSGKSGRKSAGGTR